MKSETLILTTPKVIKQHDPFGTVDIKYSVPYLPAYAIVNYYIEVKEDRDLDGSLQQHQYELLDDSVLLRGQKIPLLGDFPEIRLTLQHAGIADHTKLFPYISENSLRNRLGQFASEAEKAFDSGAWASFVIMAGAVVEGILGALIPNTDNLKKLLDTALENELITKSDFKTLHSVREARNLIHAKKHSVSFIDRAKAMQVYAVYYGVLRKDWGALKDSYKA